MRYTNKEVTGMFQRLCKAMSALTDADNWKPLHLDYAPVYGGYVIEEIDSNGGCSHSFGCLRRNAREMYLSMHMRAQALEDIRYKQELLNKYEIV